MKGLIMTIDLVLEIISLDETKEDIQRLTVKFAKELEKLDNVESTDIIRVEREGAMGQGLTESLLVKLAGSSGISSLLNVFGLILGKDRSRSLKLQVGNNSIEVTGLTKEEQKTLIEWFQTQAGLSFTK